MFPSVSSHGAFGEGQLKEKRAEGMNFWFFLNLLYQAPMKGEFKQHYRKLKRWKGDAGIPTCPTSLHFSAASPGLYLTLCLSFPQWAHHVLLCIRCGGVSWASAELRFRERALDRLTQLCCSPPAARWGPAAQGPERWGGRRAVLWDVWTEFLPCHYLLVSTCQEKRD